MFANHNFDHTIHTTPSGRKVGIAEKTYGFMVYDDNGMINNFLNYFDALKYVRNMA